MFDRETTYLNMSFSKRNDILAGTSSISFSFGTLHVLTGVVSTASGHIILWSRVINGAASCWEPLQKIEIAGIPAKLSWGKIWILER